MLGTLSYFPMFFLNLILVGAWHMATMTIGQKRPAASFRPESACYRPRKWEHGGRWYRDHLGINAWKDRLPQFTAKDIGFSKGRLRSLSPEYLDRFICETCRGEWVHAVNLFCIAPALLLNAPLVGLVLSLMIFLGNAPFALVQRYNRFRLQALRRRVRTGEKAEQKMQKNY